MTQRQPQVTLRAVRLQDRQFLSAVYASTREEELSIVSWTEQEKAEFVQMQFDLQDRFYRENYLDTSWSIVLVDGEPAGRLYVARWPDEIRIVDIALLPHFRGRGIGSLLIGQVVREAESAGKPLRIHVEQFNPAMRLYQRLGFRPVAQHGVYILMERVPAAHPDQLNTAS